MHTAPWDGRSWALAAAQLHGELSEPRPGVWAEPRGEVSTRGDKGPETRAPPPPERDTPESGSWGRGSHTTPARVHAGRCTRAAYLVGVDDGEEPGEQAAEEGHEHGLHHVVLGQGPVLHRGGRGHAGQGAVVLQAEATGVRERPDRREDPATPSPPLRLQVTQGSPAPGSPCPAQGPPPLSPRPQGPPPPGDCSAVLRQQRVCLF